MSAPWQPAPLELPSRWTQLVDPEAVLPEYPRPHLVRDEWRSLNGLWDFAITSRKESAPRRYPESILVPFPVESALSGIGRTVLPDQLMWYRRTVVLRPPRGGDRVLLHFDAVDDEAVVFLNGKKIGRHVGGYHRFTIDITDVARKGKNELVVRAWDPSDRGPGGHGKQVLHATIMQRYTPSSGIWQSVWLETVPATWISGLTLGGDPVSGEVRLDGKITGPAEGIEIEATVSDGSGIVAEGRVGAGFALTIPHPRPWSPDDPFLYDVEVRLVHDGERVDVVHSYVGLRTVDLAPDDRGITRIRLNGRPVFNLGVLDQGFWPDGLHTAPTDAALAFDIEAIRAMGFNAIRKHLKVEPDRWYFHCDRLGILVWQDLVPPGDSTPEARVRFEQDVAETLDRLAPHPSIIMWVLFNEELGPYDRERLGRLIRRRDPRRLLDIHSGPEVPRMVRWAKRHGGAPMPSFSRMSDWEESDVTDIHSYPEPSLPVEVPGLARVVGEYGGRGVYVEGHTWLDLAGDGYSNLTPAEFPASYAATVDTLVRLRNEGLAGAIYTQPFDVELEQNGLITYDREVVKLPLASLSELHRRLVPREQDRGAISIADVDTTPEPQRYAALVAQYDKGRGDVPFLRHLALMALRADDRARATTLGAAAIDATPLPFTDADWHFIRAVTRTTSDRGFELLRDRAAEANSSLGENAAENALLAIIGREVLDPLLAEPGEIVWDELEKQMRARFGSLGAEKVRAAALAATREREDWPAFAEAYRRYFSIASRRSEHNIVALSRLLLEHAPDLKALRVGVRATRAAIDLPLSGEPDTADFEIHARMLAAVGRDEQARATWQRAVGTDFDHDPELRIT